MTRKSENPALRKALQKNLVSFPSQVPIFKKQSRADIQWKIAILYFVQGWSMENIAKRHRLMTSRVAQIITAWRTRAVTQGYVQAIEPTYLRLDGS